MDHVELLALFDRDLREGARPDGPDARIERTGGVVRQVAPAPGWNGVVWSALDEVGADAAIAGQIGHYTGLGLAFEWKLYGHDRPADLGRRLRAAGFTPGPEETLMIGEAAALALDAAPPEGVRVVPVTDPAGVDLVADVHEKAFGADSSWLRHQLLARLSADPDTVVAVVAMDGDERSARPAWSSCPARPSPACGAAARCRAGAAAASTALWWPTAPTPPRPVATATSRSTPPARAGRSWNGSASCR